MRSSATSLVQAPAAPRASSWADRWSAWLLTDDPVQRVRLSQACLALALMGVSVLAMHYVVAVGKAPAGPVQWWTWLSIGGLVVTYVAIRSGWSSRFRDPSLTAAQMVYAIACAAGGYALAGPVRGGVFPVLVVILLFGMFQLRPTVLAAITAYAIALFGGVMAAMASWRPQVFTPAVEIGHFLMLATMLPAVALLAGRLWRVRERSLRQRKELAAALARIQELATRDELTGLINRRHMHELLEQERQRCVRSGQTYCIAVLVVDDLGEIVRTQGRVVADQVLRQLAVVASSAIRAADVLARWDDDTFVLLLTGAYASMARAGLERLRDRVAATDFDVLRPGQRIALSAGLAEHIAGESVQQALGRAERALDECRHGRAPARREAA